MAANKTPSQMSKPDFKRRFQCIVFMSKGVPPIGCLRKRFDSWLRGPALALLNLRLQVRELLHALRGRLLSTRGARFIKFLWI